MPQRDIINNSIVNELGNTVVLPTANNTVINNSNNKSQIVTLLDTNSKISYPKTNSNPIIISSSPSNIQYSNNSMDNINNYPPKEEKNNYLNPYTYANKNIDSSSPIAIHPPPPPTALNQFSFQPNTTNVYLSSTENVNSFFNNSKSSNHLEATTSFQSDQSNILKDSKMGSSSFISPSSVHLLPQDNLYSQSYQPFLSHEVTNGISGNRLSSSFTYKNNLLANVNTARKTNVTFTKGIPISENTLIKSQRMHRKRTMRLTKQAQNEVSIYYNFDVNLLLQISVEQWVDFITITTFFLWQYPDIQPSATFIDDAYDTICEADLKEKNYFFAYRRFLYQFMVKSSPNPFVILYAIVYLFKLRESAPDAIVTPRSETFVFPVLVMIADKFIQDVHQLPAKYWAMASKMDTDDLILFQRKIMKYLGYSLLVNYDEIENVVTLLEEFINRDLELDTVNQDMSSPSSSNSYPTPPISQQSSIDFGFSMFNDNIDSTNSLDAKEAEILIYTFRKVLNEQDEYIPMVFTSSNLPLKYNKKAPRIGGGIRYGEEDGIDGDDEREDYNYKGDSPAVISSYHYSNNLPVPLGRSSHPKLSSSAPKSLNSDVSATGRSKRLSVGKYSITSISPASGRYLTGRRSFERDNSSAYQPNNYNPKRCSISEPFNVYEGKKNSYHSKEDLEFKKYSGGSGKKISMLSKAMNLLKNDKNKVKVSKNSVNAIGKAPSFTLPRNFKSSKFNTKSNSTGNISTNGENHRDSPYPINQNNQNSYSENQIYGPYFSSGKSSGKSSKRNSKSIVLQTNRYSISTTVSNTSQNKRYSLPIYASNNYVFNGVGDTCYSNPPENQTQKLSIINKKIEGSETPEDYLFKDTTHLKNPGANLELQRSPVKPKLVPKLVSINNEFTPDINDNNMNRSFNIEDTQGPSLANVSFSQINRSQYREKEEEQGPGNYIDYNQAVNMLKSIPFGDDAVVKSMENIVVRRDNDDEELKLINSGLKSKTSKTAFLFRKNPLKSNHGQEGGYVKKHAKSKSLFSTSSGHKKNASVGKKFYTLGHNHSENSLNAGYFVPEKDNKYKGNYFSQEFETPYMIEEEEEVYQEEENNPMSRTEEVRKNESFPKRSGSNKSVKWLGKIMKTIQLKK